VGNLGGELGEGEVSNKSHLVWEFFIMRKVSGRLQYVTSLTNFYKHLNPPIWRTLEDFYYTKGRKLIDPPSPFFFFPTLTQHTYVLAWLLLHFVFSLNDLESLKYR